MESLRIDRFDEMNIESDFLGTAAVRFLSPSAQGHQLQASTLRQIANSEGGFVAVELRQSDVEKNQVGPERRHHLDGFEAVVCSADFVAAQFQEQRPRGYQAGAPAEPTLSATGVRYL